MLYVQGVSLFPIYLEVVTVLSLQHRRRVTQMLLQSIKFRCIFI